MQVRSEGFIGQSKNFQIGFLSLFFFASGVAALIYQLAWQRLLFVAIGVDLESVTLIVAVFMMGLGVGALVGGSMADRFPSKTVFLFGIAEAGVGVFGFFSADMLSGIGGLLLHSSTPTVALVCFFVLLVPTLLMGATLPILVTHLSRIHPNIGHATGLMYSANTLGAASGAMLSTFVLFEFLNLDQALYLAASTNLVVAFAVGFFGWACHE